MRGIHWESVISPLKRDISPIPPLLETFFYSFMWFLTSPIGEGHVANSPSSVRSNLPHLSLTVWPIFLPLLSLFNFSSHFFLFILAVTDDLFVSQKRRHTCEIGAHESYYCFCTVWICYKPCLRRKLRICHSLLLSRRSLDLNSGKYNERCADM